MPANKWELRADVRPLERAAAKWSELGRMMSRRADDLVDAARHALDGWDAATAESYESHRRQVIENLDRFTTLAGQIAGSLSAVSSMVTSSQKELDQAWVNVSLVPHTVIGADRVLVFREEDDDDRAKVSRCEMEADEIRRRLTLSLDTESTRLRSARAEFMLVRASLVQLAGGAFPVESFNIEVSGVGSVDPASTSVLGTAESGVGLPPIGPISVSMPNLSGIATAGLAPILGAAASGAARRRGAGGPPLQGGMPPMGGGMAAGAMRSGSAMSGGAAGRRTSGGSSRLATPKLPGAQDDDAARLAREKEAAKQAAKEAKQAAIAEKRAERAARKAERQAEREDDKRDESGLEVDESAIGDETAAAAELRPANLTVVEVAPGEERPDARL